MLSVILATTLGIYLVWAEVLSDSLFHRVLSIALCLLAFLTAKLLSLPVSTFTISLIILTLLIMHSFIFDSISLLSHKLIMLILIQNYKYLLIQE